MMNNYFESVKKDIKQLVRYNEIEIDYTELINNRDSVEESLYDDLWINDSVTGNASGSYFCNSYKAKETVLEDMDTVKEALKEFCVSAETIGEKFLNEEWEYLDVTARCYVLGSALSSALDELIEEYETENDL